MLNKKWISRYERGRDSGVIEPRIISPEEELRLMAFGREETEGSDNLLPTETPTNSVVPNEPETKPEISAENTGADVDIENPADAVAGNQEAGYGFEEMPKYESKYTEKIDELYNRIFGGSGFTGAGDRARDQAGIAMRDTLGRASAATGGMASSYAVGAAMQQYGDVLADLELAAAQADAATREADMQELAYLMTLDEEAEKKFYEDLEAEEAALGGEATPELLSDDELYNRWMSEIKMLENLAPAEALKLFQNGFDSYKSTYMQRMLGNKQPIDLEPGQNPVQDPVQKPEQNPEQAPNAADDTHEITGDNVNRYYSDVVNQNGEDWVYVHGYGRLSFSELEYLVDNGYIHESQREDGSLKYTKIK